MPLSPKPAVYKSAETGQFVKKSYGEVTRLSGELNKLKEQSKNQTGEVKHKTEEDITSLRWKIKVADYFDIKISDMKTKKRTRQVAYPRHIAMYLIREMTDLTLPEIGGHFGGRDHSTVIHACDKIDTDLKKNQNVKNLVQKLMLDIKS